MRSDKRQKVMLVMGVFGALSLYTLNSASSSKGRAAGETQQKEIQEEGAKVMTALDRRMRTYFQSYRYVSPVQKTFEAPFLAKECGAAPSFDKFFSLDHRQRSANDEDKWIYQHS